MKSRFVRGAVMLLTLSLGMLFLLDGTAENAQLAENSNDVVQALGFSALFEGENMPDGNVSREDSLEKTTSAYTDISLREMLLLAQKLEEGRWYLTGDQALKNGSSLLLRYDLRTLQLRLELTKDSGKAVWPDVLTPQLAGTTPVFTGGTFKDSAPREILNRLDSVTLVYAEVLPEEVQAYEALLGQSGYEPRIAQDNSTEFAKGLNFVRLLYHANDERLDITVGRYLVYFVPLPPWPDTLPEQLRRSLPPVAPKPTVDVLTSGYLATVMDMPLFSLYRFVHGAQSHYGWSAFGDDAVMTHQTMPVRMEFLAWNTDTHRLIFLLDGDAQVPAPVLAP